ncbi:hypothetical protein GCM10022220_10120 [Actinocatenispora rupis]
MLNACSAHTGPAGNVLRYTAWSTLPTVATTRFAPLYDARSLVRAALYSIGRVPATNSIVATVPAADARYGGIVSSHSSGGDGHGRNRPLPKTFGSPDP